MEETFDLPVIINGKEQLFSASLQQTGYTYRILVDVHGQEVAFEPDEEKNFRAVLLDTEGGADIEPDLLKSIAETIEALLQ